MTAEFSAELLDEHFRLAPVVHYICAANEDFPVLYISANVETLFGIAPSAILSDPGYWFTRIHPHDLLAVQRDIKRIAAGEAVTLEYRFLGGEGEFLWVRDHCHPVGEGAARRLYGFCSDISAAKNAESLLAQQEKIFRAIADHTYNWENWFDPQGRLLWVNPAVETFTGYTPAECHAMGDFPRPLVANEERERFATLFPKALSGERGELEARLLRKDGTTFWAKVAFQPIYDEAGKFLGHRSSITDISDQKAMQDTLRLTEERLHAVLDHIPQRVFWKNTDSIYLGCNRAYAEERGLSGEEAVIGRSDFDFHSKSDALHYRKVDAEVMHGDRPALDFEEKRHPLGDGDTVRWVRTSKLPLHDSDGNVIGVVGIYADITEERELRHKLKESLQTLQAILDTAQVGILYVVERKVVWVNLHFTQMFGYKHGEIFGKDTGLLYRNQEDYERYGQEAHIKLARGKAHDVELPLKRKNGKVFWCHGRGMLVDRHHPEKGAIWVLVDIDQRKHLQRELVLLNANLMERIDEEIARSLEKERLLVHQARHAAMGEMIGNIAHQWRQPLNLLGLILQNIAMDYADQVLDADAMEDYNSKAQKAIRQMSATIDDFRNFFRPDRLQEAFEIGDALHEALNLVEAALVNNGIELSISCPHGLKVWGHRNELAQVFLNLLGNAKDALLDIRPPRMAVSVRVERHEGNVTISVADSAGGIPEQIREKIFDPYFTTKEKGTGIGLYMTRTIVEQHMHGQIAVRNGKEGAEFTLTLPLYERGD